MTIKVRRLKHLEQAPSVDEADLPWDPAPDLVWPIDPGSAVGKGLRKAIVSAAEGRRGSGPRLIAYLHNYHAVTSGGRTAGSVPPSLSSLVVGWYTDRTGVNAIRGYVMWFDKEPARETVELSGLHREI